MFLFSVLPQIPLLSLPILDSLGTEPLLLYLSCFQHAYKRVSYRSTLQRNTNLFKLAATEKDPLKEGVGKFAHPCRLSQEQTRKVGAQNLCDCTEEFPCINMHGKRSQHPEHPHKKIKRF
jgi:hypothetical protein